MQTASQPILLETVIVLVAVHTKVKTQLELPTRSRRQQEK